MQRYIECCRQAGKVNDIMFHDTSDDALKRCDQLLCGTVAETALATAKYMEYNKWKMEDNVVVEKS